MRFMREARRPANRWGDKAAVEALHQTQYTVREMRAELREFRSRHKLQEIRVEEIEEERMADGEIDLDVAMAALEALGRVLMREIVRSYREAGMELPPKWAQLESLEEEPARESPRLEPPRLRAPVKREVVVLDSPEQDRDPAEPKVSTRPQRANDPVAGVAGEGEIDDETLHVVYGGRREETRLRRENAKLKQRDAEMRGERKRLWEEIAEGAEEGRRKRARTGTMGMAIQRKDIEEIKGILEREAAYQRELHANPYIQFAMDVANYVNAGRQSQYAFVNSVYANMLQSMYGGGKEMANSEVARAMTIAEDALMLIGSMARTFPGRLEELEDEDFRNDLPREVFERLYRDLTDAVRVKRERAVMLDTLRALSRPDASSRGIDLLDPSILLTAKRVLSTAALKAGLRADVASVSEVINDTLGRQILARAVGLTRRGDTKDTSALYQSRMDRGAMANKLSSAFNDLGEYVKRTWGRGFAGGLATGTGLGVSGANEVVSLRGEGGSRQVRYTAAGIPVSLGF